MLSRDPQIPAGSIPACAGEPSCPLRGATLSGVYPRVCGGTAARSRNDTIFEGLSPRVRGNPYRAVQPNNKKRSIPACAGEPEDEIVSIVVEWVYPRVCGGTPVDGVALLPPGGLSPRVRGNLLQLKY